MEYFLLFIHYGFYVFFIMCFAAYVYAATENKKIEILSIVGLAVYSVLELSTVLLINSCFQSGFIYSFFIVGILVSAAVITVLRLKNCADMSIWMPFCLVFSPLIVVPVLVSTPFIKVKK